MSTLSRVAFTKESKAFVCSSFGGSFAKYSGLTDRREFDRIVIAPFERALDEGGASVMVLTSSPDDFVGWVLAQGDTLVYLYVKQAYRGRGVGRSLLPDGLERAVFQTPAGMRLQRHKYGRVLRPAPYALLAERRAA